MNLVGKCLTKENFSLYPSRMTSFLKFSSQIWLLLLFVLGIAVTQSMDYSDLQFTGAACSPKDTCNRGVDLPFANRTCECDDQCRKYSDCCIDVNRPTRRRALQTIQSYGCLVIAPEMGVYVLSTCQGNWDGSEEIRRQCEELSNISNPLASAPVTDISRNVTYKNHYCAECNNVEPRNLRSWEIDIECAEIPDNTSIPVVDAAYIENYLAFVPQNNSWGFYYPGNHQQSSERRFYPCQVPFRLPNSLNQSVRYCRPNLVSSCATSWRRNVVRQRCEAYMAVVYVAGEVYRNPHCAICNNRDTSAASCSIPGQTVAARGKKPAISFTLLMDVNMSDGNRVGEVRDDRCPNNEKWDPFAKKCRTLACAIPGYRIQDGECVRP